jgi:hypothetical protein
MPVSRSFLTRRRAARFVSAGGSGKRCPPASRKSSLSGVPTETSEACALMDWVRATVGRIPALALLFHIPNGGRRSKKVGAELRRMGLKPGVWDYLLPVVVHGCPGLWIELKRRKGGATNEEQDEWGEAMRDQGYRTVVALGWEQARDALLEYLNEY